jgi:hypothetical protein
VAVPRAVDDRGSVDGRDLYVIGHPIVKVASSSAYAGYDHPLRKLAHVLEYAGLNLLLYRAFRLHVYRPSRAWLLAGLVAALYAVSDEWHQTFVPGREGTACDGIGVMGPVCCRPSGAFRRPGVADERREPAHR